MSLIANKKRKVDDDDDSGQVSDSNKEHDSEYEEDEDGSNKYKITLPINSIESYSLSNSLSTVEEERNTLIRKLIGESIQELNARVEAYKTDDPRLFCLWCSRESNKFNRLPGWSIKQEITCKRILKLRKTDNQDDPDRYSQEKMLSDVSQGYDRGMICTDCRFLCRGCGQKKEAELCTYEKIVERYDIRQSNLHSRMQRLDFCKSCIATDNYHWCYKCTQGPVTPDTSHNYVFLVENTRENNETVTKKYCFCSTCLTCNTERDGIGGGRCSKQADLCNENSKLVVTVDDIMNQRLTCKDCIDGFLFQERSKYFKAQVAVSASLLVHLAVRVKNKQESNVQEIESIQSVDTSNSCERCTFQPSTYQMKCINAQPIVLLCDYCVILSILYCANCNVFLSFQLDMNTTPNQNRFHCNSCSQKLFPEKV